MSPATLCDDRRGLSDMQLKPAKLRAFGGDRHFLDCVKTGRKPIRRSDGVTVQRSTASRLGRGGLRNQI